MAAVAALLSGALDQRLTLQQRVAGANALGEASGAWVDVATVWGSAQPLRSRELFAAGQAQSITDVRFAIRWRADVQSTWRVVWRGEPHDIVGAPIDVDGRRRTLELMCTTGLRDGR